MGNPLRGIPHFADCIVRFSNDFVSVVFESAQGWTTQDPRIITYQRNEYEDIDLEIRVGKNASITNSFNVTCPSSEVVDLIEMYDRVHLDSTTSGTGVLEIILSDGEILTFNKSSLAKSPLYNRTVDATESAATATYTLEFNCRVGKYD